MQRADRLAKYQFQNSAVQGQLHIVQRAGGKRKKPTEKASAAPRRKIKKSRFRRYDRDLSAFGNNTRMLYDNELHAGMTSLITPGSYAFPVCSLGFLPELIETSDNLLLFLDGGDLAKRTVMIINTSDDQEDDDGHWICILVDSVRRKILIVDPFSDDSEEDCQSAVVQPMQTFLEATVEPLMPDGQEYDIDTECMGVQADNYNCGVWALVIVEQFLRDENFDNINSQHMATIDIQAARRRWSRQIYGQ